MTLPVEVIVPEVGEVGMEITFTSWLKDEGETVHEGDELFEVDTDKSTLEVEAVGSGVLADCRVGAGDVIHPHQVIAVLLREGETLEDTEARATAPDGARATTVAPAASAASPSARRRARKLGVPLDHIQGTGPDGLITSDDVEAVASTAGSRVGADANRSRRAIAASTQRTWQTVPHIHLTAEMDVTTALNMARPTPLLCAAVVRALARHPEFNVVWTDEGMAARDMIDLGLLVDTPTGLAIGRVPEADALGLRALEDSLRGLISRALEGRLRPDDLGPRTLTVSNLGMFAVDRFSGVIASPDPMLLSIGRIRTTPRLVDGEWAATHVVDLTLTLDHRALDGADGGRLLGEIEAILNQPEVLREVR